jgi:hypothetical protein
MVANGDRQRAEQGLHEALDRFEARASDSSLGDPLVPFAEALNWAYSLEEWHEAQLRKAGVDYYAKRDNDADGEVVAGVIYARGLVAHHLAKVGLVASLDRYYDDYGAYGNLVWRPFSELPPPDKPEKKERDEKYKQRVQHKRLSVTMRAVERFLTGTVLSYYRDFADPGQSRPTSAPTAPRPGP